jgi:alpha-mannosidase
MKTVTHIINHTHWDREWFLTSIYTSQWIPALIDRLVQLVAENPDFQFWLDGQTLVIEDLLQLRPDYQDKVNGLIENGRLLIGPYYCQPDWQLTGGESLIRNLFYGRQDMKKYGDNKRVGWLVDTFGHISQAPQLHQLFGLETVFVWRGVPQLEPYFHWQGANGQQVLAVNLFGGYRNLYGITHVPEVAVKRLETEVSKLQPFYPTSDIPLFDGYDLEQNPEDPVRFYQQCETAVPAHIHIKESSPNAFAQIVQGKLLRLPTITGDLNSGKYGATFPGTLSARTYLKVMNGDCERLLYQLCEPLAVLARLKGRTYDVQQYETWGRALLQNTVHDCLCGVSIDQVHEKMEYSYRQLYQAIKKDVDASLTYILHDFSPGVYAVSANPFASEGWQVVEDNVYHLATDGVGVWKIDQQLPVESPHDGIGDSIAEFEWQNDHYTAAVNADGTVQMGAATLGHLVVTEEKGDTYSDEAGHRRAVCSAIGPLIIEQRSVHHAIIRYDCACQWDNAHISATVRLIFDQTPLLRWQVDLDSRGTGFKVEMMFATTQTGDVYAGLPVDVVKRPIVDQALLPRQLDKGLAKVLLGQRELEQVTTFPFHDFVALSGGTATTVILAKSIHAYQAQDDGTISLTLRRSVEWLTMPDLQHRAGDAGPFMYVPDARCERTVRHEMGVMVTETDICDLTIHQINASFQNPPLIVSAQGKGEQTRWQLLQENLPLSSLSFTNGKLLARFHNPTESEHTLNQVYRQTDIWGNSETTVKEIPAKNILTLEIEEALPTVNTAPIGQIVTTTIFPAWRVGDNKGLPDLEIIAQIEAKIAQLETHLTQVEEQLNNTVGNGRYAQQHRCYVLERELYEVRLSALLNRRKLAQQGSLDYDYLYVSDPEIAKLGRQLNELRIKRRIYDYVVNAV